MRSRGLTSADGVKEMHNGEEKVWTTSGGRKYLIPVNRPVRMYAGACSLTSYSIRRIRLYNHYRVITRPGPSHLPNPPMNPQFN